MIKTKQNKNTRNVPKSAFWVSVTVVFLFHIYSQSFGQQIHMEIPKETVKIYEPVFINFSVEMKEKKKPRLKLFINNKDRGNLLDTSLEKEHKIKRKEDGKIIYSGYTVILSNFKEFKELQLRLLFSEPGDYKVYLKDANSDKKSNSIQLHAKSLNKNERGEVDLFYGKDLLLTITSVSYSPEKDLKELKQLLNDFPESEYAPYAKYVLLTNKWKKLKANRSSIENIKKKARFNQEYNKYIKKIPFPSLWHAKAEMIRAESMATSVKFFNGKYGTTTDLIKLLNNLKESYTHPPISNRVSKHLKEMKKYKNDSEFRKKTDKRASSILKALRNNTQD